MLKYLTNFGIMLWIAAEKWKFAGVGEIKIINFASKLCIWLWMS